MNNFSSLELLRALYLACTGVALFDTRGSHRSPARQYVVLVTLRDLSGASVH